MFFPAALALPVRYDEQQTTAFISLTSPSPYHTHVYRVTTQILSKRYTAPATVAQQESYLTVQQRATSFTRQHQRP